MSNTFIIGVSHIRSFANDLFTCIFLGSGSNLNLHKGFQKLNNEIDVFIKKKLYTDKDIVILQIGEESVRYILRNEFYPHKLDPKQWNEVYKNDIKTLNSVSGKKEIDVLVERYIQLINKIKEQIPNLFILSSLLCTSIFSLSIST